ncbi:hypothetical protein BGZ51_000635 [Haplosporangium sp. Z 767]|nr:hypothetical protein BGZ51_000635 [Haplosporangium sp. Z 767]
MSTQTISPKRIADYFFMVGLQDDFSLISEPKDQHSCNHQNQNPNTLQQSHEANHHPLQQADPHSSLFDGNTTKTPAMNLSARPSPKDTSSVRVGGQGSGVGQGTELAASPFSSSAVDLGTVKSLTRTRSKSVAQFQYNKPAVPALFQHHNLETPIRHNISSTLGHVSEAGEAPLLPERPESTRRPSAMPMQSKRPSRRSVTMSDVSHRGGSGTTGLHHKPSYRHVSAGTLYKTVQEGLQSIGDLTKEMIWEEDEQRDTAVSNNHQAFSSERAGPAALKRQDTYPNAPLAAYKQQDKAALSMQGMNGLAFGNNATVIRSRSKTVHGMHSTLIDNVNGVRADFEQKPPDVSPEELHFTPVVTCRYPEKDWDDAEAFPLHLPMFCFPEELSFKLQRDRPPTTFHSFVMTQETGNRSYAMCVTLYERMPESMQQQFAKLCQKWRESHMSDSEMEYAKAIKTKISKEKRILRVLRDNLREERTLGRKARLVDLKRDILDSEEKLSLLEDQMKPWSKLFIEAEDVWIPRCVGLVSAIPYHYLLRDWLLAVVVACSGGVDHPGMSMNSLPIESYVKNIIHDVSVPPLGKQEIGITINNRVIYASRPALNTVPIVKNFSLFPLFRCLSAEDIVTILEMMLSEGRIIFVSSYLGMLTLASESLLYLFFPLFWQGVYIPILPAGLMTCLQAPVPYIIGVGRNSCDSDFPPEEACVVDLDKGTIQVQLAPIPLPPRPRRKLVQSLEQYAPACIQHRSASSDDSSQGPPDYIKEAFPYSRMALFCGVSRAPKWNRRAETLRPPATSTFSTTTAASSTHESSPSVSRKSSTNTLGQKGLNPNVLPTIPKVDFEKEALFEGSLIGPDLVETKDTEASEAGHGDSKDRKANRVAPEMISTEIVNTATRRLLTPQRARANIFEIPKKPDQQQQLSPANITMMHPHMNRSTSSQNSHIMTSDSPAGGALTHRISLTSLDSSNSSVFLKSTSTALSHGTNSTGSQTSNTMGSINGPSLVSVALTSPSVTSLPPLMRTANNSVYNHTSGASFVEEEVEDEPELSVPITREGHVFISVPTPLSNARCSVCSHVIVIHQHIYRCEGCSFLAHAGCIDELLYPCVPRGFDESAICWSVLQMWAGLLKGYRSGILAGQMYQLQSLPQAMQSVQNQSPRVYGHAKQLSGSGSEGDKEPRLSWASFRGWTSRSNNNSPSANTRGPNTFSPSIYRSSASVDQTNQLQQQQRHPATRARSGTTGSVQSDTVRFHRDVFLKSVDKEAKPFMLAFTESQAFVQFVQDRVDRSPGDPEIMFFDEVIKAKINRSRFRIGKEETKFLDDPSYGIQNSVKAKAPSGEFHYYVFLRKA